MPIFNGMVFGVSGQVPPSPPSGLSSDITCNSVTKTASWRYKAADASTSSWPGVQGPTLTAVGSTSAITLGTDSSGAYVQFDTDADADLYFQSAAGAYGLPSAHAGILEVIYEIDMSFTDNQHVLSTYTAAENTGFAIRRFASGDWLSLQVNTGAGYIGGSSFAYGGTTKKIHVLVFLDDNYNSTDGSRLYANGAAHGAGVNISTLTQMTGGGILIGSDPFLNYYYKGKVYEAAFWNTSDAWFPSSGSNPTVWAATATARFAQVQAAYNNTF